MNKCTLFLIIGVIIIIIIIVILLMIKKEKYKDHPSPIISHKFLTDIKSGSQLPSCSFQEQIYNSLKNIGTTEISETLSVVIIPTTVTINKDQPCNNITSITCTPSTGINVFSTYGDIITFIPTSITGIGNFIKPASGSLTLTGNPSSCTGTSNCSTIPFTMDLENEDIVFTGNLTGNLTNIKQSLEQITVTISNLTATLTGTLDIICSKACITDCSYNLSKIDISTTTISKVDTQTSQSWSTFMSNVLTNTKSILNDVNDLYCSATKDVCVAGCVAKGSVAETCGSDQATCEINCISSNPGCVAACIALGSTVGKCGAAQAYCSATCWLNNTCDKCTPDWHDCMGSCDTDDYASSFPKCDISSCEGGCSSTWHDCMGPCDTDDYPSSFPKCDTSTYTPVDKGQCAFSDYNSIMIGLNDCKTANTCSVLKDFSSDIDKLVTSFILNSLDNILTNYSVDVNYSFNVPLDILNICQK